MRETGQSFWEGGVSRRRFALINMAFGYVNMGFGIVVGLVLIPLYLEKIGVRMYGYWLATGGVVYWLGMLDMGIGSLVGQRIAAAYGARDKASLGAYYIAGWVIQLVLFGLLAITAGGVAFFVPRIINVTGEEARVLSGCAMIAGLGLGVQFITNAQSNTLNALQRPVVKFIGQCAGAIITIGATFMLLERGVGLYAIPGSMLLGSLVNLLTIGGYASWLIWQSGATFVLRRDTLREMGRLASRAFFASAANALVGRIEPTIITMALSPELAVVFTMTRRAADLLSTVVSMIVGSSAAGLTNLHASGDSTRTRKTVKDLFTLTTSVSLVLAVAYLTMNRTFIALWVGPQYFAGTGTTLALVFVMICGGASGLFISMLTSFGDFPYTYGLTAAEGLFRLGMMALLLFSVRQIVVVAGAAAVASFVVGVLAAIRLARVWKMPVCAVRDLRLMAVSAAGLLLLAALGSEQRLMLGWTAFVGMGLAVAAVACCWLWLVNHELRAVVIESTRLLGARTTG